MAATAQWKLRRLAARAVRVFERRGGENPVLKAFETTMVPVAKEFIASYDSVKRFNAKWQTEMREGRGAVSELVTTIRRWLPRLSVDLPHFDRTTFADTAVPDDIMEDAERLRDTVLEHQELAADASSGIKPLSYAEVLLPGLRTSDQGVARSRDCGQPVSVCARHNTATRWPVSTRDRGVSRNPWQRRWA